MSRGSSTIGDNSSISTASPTAMTNTFVPRFLRICEGAAREGSLPVVSRTSTFEPDSRAVLNNEDASSRALVILRPPDLYCKLSTSLAISSLS